MESAISIQQSGPRMIVRFNTEALVNPLELERIGTALLQWVDDHSPADALLDFTKVRYFSSQAIGMLASLNKKFGASKGAVILCGVGPQLAQLLKITRLDRVLKIVDSMEDAQ